MPATQTILAVIRKQRSGILGREGAISITKAMGSTQVLQPATAKQAAKVPQAISHKPWGQGAQQWPSVALWKGQAAVITVT